MRRIASLFVFSVALLASVHAETLQEQLGFRPEDRLLIIHADDVGMCHSVNVATIDAMEKGVITSGSIMMPCAWVPEIIDYCCDHPEADFGLHLTLNSEWEGYRWAGLASRNAIRGLLDPMGYLWDNVPATAAHATPEQVQQELVAQIEHALRMGLQPTHIDTHMGTIYARREYLEIAFSLAEEYGIPFMVPEPTPQVLRDWGERGPWVEEFLNKARSSGMPLLSGLYMSYEFENEEAKLERYREIIRNLPAGVSQLIVHLGKESDELEAITSRWRIRTTDYSIMVGPEIREILKEENVHLIGWKPIRELWRKRKG